MKDIIVDDLQNTVDEYLLRHRSIMDILTKIQESSARINRAVAKSVTECGCIRINASKQETPPDATLEEAHKYFKTHLEGQLCENCKEVIEAEIGNNVFYIIALCNVLGLNFYDILLKKHKELNTLGIFNML
ncbi:hypothetical protein JCM16816_21120 [Thermoanaerobacter brockii subsp. lactiethylicus]|jgi:hypothetical protein|uniref:hypothetical protein n=1 Tax=unclassified Thermoanaerobacter TaxID=2636821 RepID=UPI0000E1E132|nr:hypothetical protein [Thermoanaerobacter sp. X514]KUJ90225.1 MAG: hypothetical protein XD37_1571 [Thermoanaerobacter thermocopriae]MDI3500421.1 hypothetical protein [Thermoanaerobacter sp.]ABY92140.1 hypothetical protein Teth514_0837 [Thermoanaerobacter sp. X514]HAA64746.1 DUF1573 domain-containing protein [Thermoanaerobacter sp.]HCD09063.1 DUF1573 domain-containing protein [Thermoanaerobacter sp.]